MKSVESTGRYLKRHYNQNDLYNMLKIAKSVRGKLKLCKSEDIKSNTDLNYSAGLCYMLIIEKSALDWYFFDIVDICQESWKHNSGVHGYPIKEVKGVDTWEGENLLLRKSLLNHVIYCLETALEIYPSVLTKEEILNLKEGKGLIDVYQPEEEPNYFYEGLKRGALTALFVFLITCTIISFLN